MSAHHEPAAIRTARPSVPPAPGSLRRILVVDDDQEIRHLTTFVLLRSGYQVDEAEDGAAAWEALQAGHYDLLITDHSMPKVTGVELVRQLRGARMGLPVILATGTLPTAEINRDGELRLAATLSKPFGPDQLLETVRKVLDAPGPLPHGSMTPKESVTGVLHPL